MTQDGRVIEREPRGLAALSGREWLEGVVAGRNPGPPALEALGIRMTAIGEGLATLELDPGELHDNGLGMVHGGIVTAMIDAAAGCAVLSLLPPGRFGPSQDIRVSFVRPVVPGAGPVTTEGRVLNLSRRTALAEATIRDRAGRLLAHGTLTCVVVEPHARRADGEGS